MQIDRNGVLENGEATSPANQYSSTDDAPTANGMEVDEADPEAPSTPTPEPVRTLTNGHSIGIQSESSIDLGPRTEIMTLSSSPSQVVMHLAWNPTDPTVLATAGDALCRIWHIPKGAPLSEPYHDILSPSDESLVSTMSWSPDGEILAIAIRNTTSSDWIGAVSLWTKHGKHIEDWPATQEMVILLRWDPQGTRLLGVTSSGEKSSSVIVWDISSSSTYAPCLVDGELRDAAWMGDGRFVVCGRGIIATSYYPSPGTVALEIHHHAEITSRTWTHTVHDPATVSTVCAAEDENLLLRLRSYPNDLEVTVRRDVHADQITALELQKTDRQSLAKSIETGKPIATCSLDGTTKIWSTPSLDLLNVLNPAAFAPATALSFSSANDLLAVANQNRILVWSPSEQGPPKAMWKGELGRADITAHGGKKSQLLTNGNGLTHNEHPMPDRDSAVGDVAEEDGAPSCCISWALDGKKLALGVNNQVCAVYSGIFRTLLSR